MKIARLNYKRIGIIIVFFIALYCLWLVVRPANIIKVDDNVVFVEHLPMTAEGKLNWWLKNKDILNQKYHIFSTTGYFVVIIMNFAGYEELPKGTRDGSVDDYTCFEHTEKENKNCVYNDIAIIIRGSGNGKVFITGKHIFNYLMAKLYYRKRV